MCREPTIGIARALGVARASWVLANDAINVGVMPKPQAVTMAKSTSEAAVVIQGVLDDFGLRFSPVLLRALRDGGVDLETMSDLASFALSHNLTAKNALHFARAMRYTAAQAIRSLSLADSVLSTEGG